MSKVTYGSILAHTSDATFRAWGSELSTNLCPVFSGAALTEITAASTAASTATAANAAIHSYVMGGTLLAANKAAVVAYYDALIAEQSAIDAKATGLGITTEKTAYDNALSTLTSYLATLTTPTLWSNLGGDTTTSLASLGLISTGGVTVTGNSITKTAATGSWNAGAYCPTVFDGAAYVSGRLSTIGVSSAMIGLNTDPTADSNYTSIDFAIYPVSSLTYVYENGSQITNDGRIPSVSDVFSITYENTTVTYAVNGVVLRTVEVGASKLLYFDGVIWQNPTSIIDIEFGATRPQSIRYAFSTAYAAKQKLLAKIVESTQNIITPTVTLERSGDSGQIDWTTVTRPAINLSGGYEVFKFKDAFANSAPVYIRLDYGTAGTATYPRIWATVGSGSDGNGTITGARTARTICTQGDEAVASTVQNFQTYICTLSGYLGLSFKHGSGSIGSNAWGFLVVGRTIGTSGLQSADGVTVCAQQNSGATGYTAYPVQFNQSTISTTGTTGYTWLPFSSINTFNNGAVYAIKQYTTVNNLVRCMPYILSYANAEIPTYNIFDAKPAGGGVTYTYLALGSGQLYGGVNPVSTMSNAMIYQ